MDVLERSHLKIIQEVAREGSLTAAALRLNLTQPALSHAVRRVENQLGVKVWRREGRSLVLTQAGEWLLSLANRLLPQFELAENRLEQFGNGERGTLRIGMECHPCYQWLLKVVSPYLDRWPKVDVDVRQKFQFGGMGALFSNEIDLLVTPDPLYKPGLKFTPVFDYELVLVVGGKHPLRNAKFAVPEQLSGETLITYPVPSERLDIYTQFLQPAGIAPRQQKQIETTDIMLVMVAHGRGVAALPRWLVDEYAGRFDLHPVKLGKNGIAKQIFLGQRETDEDIQYLHDFIEFAASPSQEI
ncbi:LysR family transcriptional regulator [Acetobacter orleanensis]|uniref:HTH-type transcriptional regulator MetR n=1 Tax=Acetobacter orleanensis TaxID=104099 RepID=A0A4Y3TK62_9PROT|nr:LysR family transcriptional regulator [Acetobacter orleanensis]KXV66711.1 LysR family transcriptional regulator [Acetobacter orleanensis]PCD78688.1 LysR family transcriptional regulator [Acetobacter orleanensis]GAN68861.1 transcriptional regulator LysR [Acetobacter orleanensis JCM 7639]GBR25663.1 LysR family transcriptional regulator [Acetobacter orleanensis NRIC 0473]GEB83381.1 LysR family transcriptional regulator [Acetobacter orleanensis]